MQESRYLYSPDGLAVTQYIMPANTLPMSSARMQPNTKAMGGVPGPHYAKNSQKKVPARNIPPLKYIVQNNPGGVYQYLTAKGYVVKNDMDDLYRQAINHIKKGDDAVVDLFRNCHPDIPTFVEALQVGDFSSPEMRFDGEDKDSETITEPKKEGEVVYKGISIEEIAAMPTKHLESLLSTWNKEIKEKGMNVSKDLMAIVDRAKDVINSRKDPEVIAERVLQKSQEKTEKKRNALIQYILLALGVVVVLYILFNRPKSRFY